MVIKTHRGFEQVGATLLLLAVMCVSGCVTPNPDYVDADEEKSHSLPDHHPQTFRRAVVDIGQRGDALTSGMLDDASLKIQLRQLLDIVRWLPELAAETDLGRRDWERLNDTAQSLARELNLSASAGQRSTVDDAALSAVMVNAMKNLVEIAALLPADILPTHSLEEQP